MSTWTKNQYTLSDLEDFLRRQGYRPCDIPACNCGLWHGGHASERLREIREAFDQDELTQTNGKTLLDLVWEVLEDRADYKLRAERAEFLIGGEK